MLATFLLLVPFGPLLVHSHDLSLESTVVGSFWEGQIEGRGSKYKGA